MKSIPRQLEDQARLPIELSLVIPVYNGSGTIAGVVEQIHEVFAGEEIEVILVNDGSADASEQVCESLVDRYPRTVSLIQLSRNFGEHNAVLAGLRYALGEYVAILDDDGQNSPADVPRMLARARLGGFDVVYARYVNRQHPRHRILGSWLNDKAANLLLKKPPELYLSSFKLINRFVVDQLARCCGPFPYLDGLILRITRDIAQVEVEHHPRQAGRSGYTLGKLAGLWLNMCIGSSIAPLRMALFTGLAISLASFIALAAMLGMLCFNTNLVGSGALVLATVCLVAGVQLTFLGAVGEYVGRIFLHQNGLPPYVVRHVRAGRRSAPDSLPARDAFLAQRSG